MNSKSTAVGALRSYLLASTGLHLLWETLQIPFYTIWQTGTVSEIAFAIVHCTAGDIVIAITTLVLALVILDKAHWPRQTSTTFKALVVLAGLTYTIFSEYSNLANGAWAYSELMPVIPGLEIGLGPAMQWLIVPLISLWFAEKQSRIR